MERTALPADLVPIPDEPGNQGRDVPAGSTRRKRLKEATSAAHRSLDRSLMQQGYFSSPERFGLYLRRMYEFHCMFDGAAMVAGRSWYKAWGMHLHKQWIETDLKDAGIWQDSTRAALPVSAISLANRSSLAGALYVIAGSSLGARVLHRLSVERQLPGPCGSYYLSQLAASVRWSDFLKFLEEADIANEDAMIEGAISAFACVSMHLNPAVPE
jgi:heme oxygenase (biliverdin-IX-beta and delta-forming)